MLEKLHWHVSVLSRHEEGPAVCVSPHLFLHSLIKALPVNLFAYSMLYVQVVFEDSVYL